MAGIHIYLYKVTTTLVPDRVSPRSIDIIIIFFIFEDMMEPEDFLELRKEVLKDQEEEKEELNAEENYNMRERIIAIRKKIFKSTEEKVQLRWKFEDAIKRPYFHMKPLERGQLVRYMP